jgi:hypothetical protein
MTETLPCVDFPDIHPVQSMYAAGPTSVFRKRATQVVPWIPREVVSFTRTGGGTMHSCADHHYMVSLQLCSSVTCLTATAYQDPVLLPFGLNKKPPAR